MKHYVILSKVLSVCRMKVNEANFEKIVILSRPRLLQSSVSFLWMSMPADCFQCFTMSLKI